ncbi:type I restriction-modification system subunit M [Patescibacteria group bacterium]|nr:type I restriction-modification system subunit M [Patescibacteria group bacterium]
MPKTKNPKKLLSIGEVAEIFGIHQDTLRNWEKKGILVPLRIGPRQDRKYRQEDIEKIAGKKSFVKELGLDEEKMTLAVLKQFLWKSADILRGRIDSSDYKKYIFGLLFYKRISDVWDEEYKNVLDEYKDEDIAKADYNHRFQVPVNCQWKIIVNTSDNIGQKLNEIFDKLTNANSPKLDKIFDDLDFANKDRFPNETLQRLINHFSQHNFGNTYINSDLLGDAYEYLIGQFAADAGKKGGEFYTPREVEKVIVGILKPHQKDHIYDPTVGSGGFLLEAYNYLRNKAGEKIARSLYLYGQERNIGTFAIAKINMFLHGLDSADIRRGDTLANPQFLNNLGNLQTFDIAVANPPYSIKDWEFELFKTDKYGRTEGYDQPPRKNADYAFVLHILKSLNVNGRAGIVLPHGVLFRGGSEGRIREQIIKNDLLEAVIGLPPKLFYGTGIPAAILIFNRNKSPEKQGKVLIIDAEKDFLEGKNQNSLRKQDIEKIIKAYDQYEDIEKYARVVDVKEIEENEYNLNVRRYIDGSKEQEQIDVKQVWNELQTLEKERGEINKKVAGFIKELGYEK